MRSGCAGNNRKKEMRTFMDEGLTNLPGGAAGGKIKKKNSALAAGPPGRRAGDLKNPVFFFGF